MLLRIFVRSLRGRKCYWAPTFLVLPDSQRYLTEANPWEIRLYSATWSLGLKLGVCARGGVRYKMLPSQLLETASILFRSPHDTESPERVLAMHPILDASPPSSETRTCAVQALTALLADVACADVSIPK